MGAVLIRLLWAVLVSGAIAYASFLFFGSVIAAETDVSLKRIVARDLIDRGAHHLSGMVFVPSGCHQLSVRAEPLTDNVERIVFSTWEEPYTECAREPVPRTFTVVVFNVNADVRFVASVDDEPVPFVVLPVSKQRI